MEHTPFRRDLDPHEIQAIEEIKAAYERARHEARRTYLSLISQAAEARDDRVLGIVEAADHAGLGQGTQSRIAERLGMTRGNMWSRLKAARSRRASQATTIRP